METQFVPIKTAAITIKKSLQTIRRAIRKNKIPARKQKTPQGFNYLVDLEKLKKYFAEREGIIEEKEGIKIIAEEKGEKEETLEKEFYRLGEISKKEEETEVDESNPLFLEEKLAKEPSPDFTKVIEELLKQHREDKERLYKLLDTFQERIKVLESQIKLLEAPKKKRWWRLGW